MSYQQMILATLAYADIFEYPLTVPELRRWMIGSPIGHIPKVVHGVERSVFGGETYMTFQGRSHIVPIRISRFDIAQNKWKAVLHIVRRFRWIPTVLLIGVTGGLSVNNAREKDDIDLFFVTKRGAIWATRFLVTITADILGVRRRPYESKVKNKICLNMFMAENSLALSESERDLFAAHEVLQMVPLWERVGVYRKFLMANRWVKYFLPNAWNEKIKEVRGKNRYVTKKFFLILYSLILILFEPLARRLQLWYMKRHRTTEMIEPGVLRFHPKDARVWVKRKYAKRLEKYNIPLDNVFYHR